MAKMPKEGTAAHERSPRDPAEDAADSKRSSKMIKTPGMPKPSSASGKKIFK